MKKFLVLIVLFLGFAFLYQVNAEACALDYEEAISIVRKANDKVYDEIEKAIEKETSLIRDHRYEEKLDRIIEILIFKTDRITDRALKKLEHAGYEAECEYILVIIGERMVYVDPIRVHTW